MPLFSIVFLALLFPSGHDPALFHANLYFSSMHYDEAATEYKRYIYFHRDSMDSLMGDSYYQLGLCLRNSGRLRESLDAFQMSLQWEGGRWSSDAKRISTAVSLTALGRYSEAEFYLLKLEISTVSAEVQKRAILLRAINSLYGSKWKEAQAALQSFIDIPPRSSEDENIQKAVQRFLAEKKNSRMKSRKLAKVLSTFIPGSGQFYGQDWKGGANALALNGIFGYLLYHDIATKHYINAALNSFFIFKRFYVGNRRNAARAVDAYNDAMNKRLAMLLLMSLENPREE
jgi:tetratricopeptide (TPR) repeat protein